MEGCIEQKIDGHPNDVWTVFPDLHEIPHRMVSSEGPVDPMGNITYMVVATTACLLYPASKGVL
jgi:hypothetical protein